jgi:CMP-N,N'-diacetyllegionaminic acid synthase
MAGDTFPVEGALIHALDHLAKSYDYIVLLQPTSPLRLSEDIDGALEKCHSSGAPACVAGCESDKSPYWTFRVDGDDRLLPLIGSGFLTQRRQDIPPAYVPNGAVFVARVPWFREHRTFYGPDTVAYMMPPERSLDIDTALDLTIVRTLLEKAASGETL